MRKILLSLTLVVASLLTYAQSVSGTVTDDAGEGLPGATVLVKGTQNGTITDVDGKFTLNVKEGTPLVVSFIGFESVEATASSNMEVTLNPGTSILAEVVITSNVIDVVKERETPVAVSSISPAEISLKVGNQEFPEVMNRTPGVYATKNGGGYGDSRLSLRGFDQSNTSFLINGQPVNDMENGWVYWSNWQGLTDVASGIQIQRGLGASRLAVPSVGGTVSIFTKAAELAKGGKVSQSVGNDNYVKTTASYSSGRSETGWASSFLLSRWSGDGYVDATMGEGWTYFGAVGYAPEGSDHAFNLSFLGAGQWHHQRDVWVSIRDYQNFGDDKKDGIDRKWNTNGGTLNGEEFNMRRNFYNKPLATVNWDWKINDNLSLATSLYGSAGRGGGTGPRGNNFRNSDINIYPFRTDLTGHYIEGGNTGSRKADGTIDFDNVVEVNRSTTTPYDGEISGYNGQLIGSNGFNDENVNRAVLIRRASMNSHNWVGGISTLDYNSGNFRYSLGVDLRKYTGYHYRVVNNLMGLDGYYSTGNQNSAGQIIETTIEASPFNNTGLDGPKINYYNIGYVNWQGLNGLVEYSSDQITGVLQGGISNQGFQREDQFAQVGNPLSKQKNLTGGYLKGGANYNLNSTSNVFFNAGYISRQPLFDAVFPGFANDVNPDLQNEIIKSVEVGYGYLGRYLTVNVNAYNTSWGNRFIEQTVPIGPGVNGTAQFKDVDVLHQGIELEATYRPIDNLKLRGMVSAGNWRYTKDFDATIFDENNSPSGTAFIYAKDAKVGDAAQFTSFISADYRFNIVSVDLSYRHVDGLYADYNIADSEFLSPDNNGALKLPSYGLVDLGVTARFEMFGTNGTFRANVNNLFDTVYIAESNTNIHNGSEDAVGETWNGIDVANSVWFGFGRTWNATLSFNF
ncbi:TonB-dependent Receptor Plug Domain [Ekhidna lutea]|uniref:TonB-dependent Receptor Plug Domain n=1 Tax=Ekhidna lutea TaxID=447679 RepID=A0A239K0N4_EKHLU|nr:TonB-dependent receptor [Ekhidna lutea]SNT11308.1 TonB-dependent Receptor Plug Domain [Ekhidna lutea]